jgi:hypothetical protein
MNEYGTLIGWVRLVSDGSSYLDDQNGVDYYPLVFKDDAHRDSVPTNKLLALSIVINDNPEGYEVAYTYPDECYKLLEETKP